MPSDDRVILITGAASGMGRLAARRLAERGARIAALDVDETGLAETASASSAIRTWRVDVTDRAAVEHAVEETEQVLGPIDRVMNAAAIMPTGFLLDQGAELIHRIMAINYGGTVNVSLATLPKMLERQRGELVNFASIAGWLPMAHFGAYNASKFAVVAFTEVLAAENARRGVRFACVCPPPVATPLLEQATSKPRILELTPQIRPEQVLDAVEEHLERGKLMVFPDRTSKRAYRLRRLMPITVDRRLRKVEGLS